MQPASPSEARPLPRLLPSLPSSLIPPLPPVPCHAAGPSHLLGRVAQPGVSPALQGRGHSTGSIRGALDALSARGRSARQGAVRAGNPPRQASDARAWEAALLGGALPRSPCSSMRPLFFIPLTAALPSSSSSMSVCAGAEAVVEIRELPGPIQKMAEQFKKQEK